MMIIYLKFNNIFDPGGVRVCHGVGSDRVLNEVEEGGRELLIRFEDVVMRIEPFNYK